jgi:DNA-3-methyladenine glycosylase II
MGASGTRGREFWHGTPGHRDHLVHSSKGKSDGPTLRYPQLQIEPRGPFRLDLTAWALRRRTHNVVDRWHTQTYERVLSLKREPVALSVTQTAGPDAPRLSVVLSGSPINQPVQAQARNALNTLLGTSVDLTPFTVMAAADPLLGPLAARMRGLKPRASPPCSRRW